jgi:enterochelin esterase-like enzyme
MRLSLIILSILALFSSSGFSIKSSLDTCGLELGEVVVIESNRTLTLLYHSNSDSVRLFGYGIHQMKKNEDECWVAEFEIEEPKKARISFFFQDFKNGTPAFKRPPEYFIGSALNRNQRVEELAGTVDSVLIDSEYLYESRWVYYYLPPNHSNGDNFHVLYMTDGSTNFVRPLARFVEYLIINEQIPPFIIVTSAANRYDGDRSQPYNPALNLRNLEYVKGFAESNYLIGVDESLFQRHRDFFLLEVGYWAEQNLNASQSRERRFLQGHSSGGSHSAIMGLERPEEFSHVFVHSTSYNEIVMSGEFLDSNLEYPVFHLVSGEFEGGFNMQTVMLESYLKRMNISYERVLGKSGHDLLMWREELLNSLINIFD